MRKGIGIALMLIGAAGMDSEDMRFPICCLIAAALLISWEVLSEKKKRIHDYTRRDDSRPSFLP